MTAVRWREARRAPGPATSSAAAGRARPTGLTTRTTTASTRSPSTGTRRSSTRSPPRCLMTAEQRIDNLISLMTLEEKVECLGTNPSVPRLGVKGSGHSEGLHGLAQGGPSDWGRKSPTTTTTFPQAIGLAETWDTDIVRRAAAVEGFEARYIFQKYNRGGLVIRAPNADLGRDPRW